jgi:uncharacterized DUF497 family protein
MDVAGFDWDDGNTTKCRKHGVSIEEIESVLSGLPRIAPDPSHSTAEDRFIAIGRNTKGRAVFIAFTFRGYGRRRFIRPISARYMHKKEAEAYDKESPQTENG